MSHNPYSPPTAQVSDIGTDQRTDSPREVQRPELIDFDSLSLRDRLIVYWGLTWRSLVMALASAVAGFATTVILQFIIGLVGRFAGFTFDQTLVISQPFAFVIALGISLVLGLQYLRWILRTKIGAYQLRLVRKPNDDA